MPHVLVVEDDRMMRRMLKHLLERHCGASVTEAGDGVEGLAALADGVRPDLVLLDVQMPGLDGAGMLQQMRADPELAALTVVAISAANDRPTLLRLIELGIKDYLLKPIDVQTAVRRLQVWLYPIVDEPARKIG